jgi:hypothetical protein
MPACRQRGAYGYEHASAGFKPGHGVGSCRVLRNRLHDAAALGR